MLPERILYRFRDLVKHNWRGVTSEEDVMNLVCTYRIVVQIHIQEGQFFYMPELENAVEKHIPDMVKTALDPGHIKNIDLAELRNVAKKDASSIQVKECFCPTAALPEDTMLRWLFSGSREFSCRILDTGKIYDDEQHHFIFKIEPGKSLEPQGIAISFDDLMISREEIVRFERECPEESKEQSTDIDKGARSAISTSGDDKDVHDLKPGEKILSGWKEVAEHTGYALDTVKKKFKNAVDRDKDTGRIITTNKRIDSYRLSKGTKRK